MNNTSRAVVLVNSKQKNRRFGKGVVIALSRKVIKMYSLLYKVESETIDNKFYIVTYKNENDGPDSCECEDYKKHKDEVFLCKHQWGVLHAIANNTVIDQTKELEKLTTLPVQQEQSKESNKYIVESWRNDKYDF